jgi:hypothetical protein
MANSRSPVSHEDIRNLIKRELDTSHDSLSELQKEAEDTLSKIKESEQRAIETRRNWEKLWQAGKVVFILFSGLAAILGFQSHNIVGYIDRFIDERVAKQSISFEDLYSVGYLVDQSQYGAALSALQYYLDALAQNKSLAELYALHDHKGFISSLRLSDRQKDYFFDRVITILGNIYELENNEYRGKEEFSLLREDQYYKHRVLQGGRISVYGEQYGMMDLSRTLAMCFLKYGESSDAKLLIATQIKPKLHKALSLAETEQVKAEVYVQLLFAALVEGNELDAIRFGSEAYQVDRRIVPEKIDFQRGNPEAWNRLAKRANIEDLPERYRLVAIKIREKSYSDLLAKFTPATPSIEHFRNVVRKQYQSYFEGNNDEIERFHRELREATDDASMADKKKLQKVDRIPGKIEVLDFLKILVSEPVKINAAVFVQVWVRTLQRQSMVSTASLEVVDQREGVVDTVWLFVGNINDRGEKWSMNPWQPVPPLAPE